MDKFNQEKNDNRDVVNDSYTSAKTTNRRAFNKGDNPKVSEHYIYPNQKEDALFITDKFYTTKTRAISIVKRTKVGMDGLMIELAKTITTHPDNDFSILLENVFFITGMSNKAWETDMKDKIPSCFLNNVFHHGKLQNLKKKLEGIKDAIIINDEIDTGDNIDQKLYKVLGGKKNGGGGGILDIEYMESNNIRFVFVSATMRNELKELCKWGDKHYTYKMTIPENYISHKDFLDLGIIKEFYPVKDKESSDRWIREDILEKYEDDFRVHIIRTGQNVKFLEDSCKKFEVDYYNHTCNDRIEDDSLKKIFDNLKNHTVLFIKGFYRRANLIPNEWKLKIGATHEQHVKTPDTNVQIQGLPGRMTGYWKDKILDGHKTGPHRTSISSVTEYENFFNDPTGRTTYNTNGSKKPFVGPRGVKNLEDTEEEKPNIIKRPSLKEIQDFFKEEENQFLGRGPKNKTRNSEGYYECITQNEKTLKSRTKEEFEKKEEENKWGFYKNDNKNKYRVYSCYSNLKDTSTLEWWLVYYK